MTVTCFVPQDTEARPAKTTVVPAAASVLVPVPDTTTTALEEEARAAAVRRVAEMTARKRSERRTYLVAAVMSSLGVTSMAVAAVYYRFSWQMKEVPVTEMLGTLALSVGAAVGMEFWARWAHRALWHASLWHMHESHHRPREGPFELNDVFAIINAAPAIALLAYGFFHRGLVPGLCFGACLGITLFGMAYMFVHDGLVHRRFPVGPIADVPYFRRVAAAHKAQHLTRDPGYLGCKNATCQKRDASGGGCRVRTCAATLTFHVVNFRTDVEFVLFSGGFGTPCVLKRSGPLRFANPARPLYGHLSSTDSAATSMRLTWVSGDGRPQQVQYGAGKSAVSQVATFTQKDMCSIPGFASPAKDFGWHDPGYIHSAVMTGLQPSQSYTYRYGSDSVGWSDTNKFRTPPAGGSDETSFVIYGDMGKAPLDQSVEHYIQPGSISVTKAVAKEIEAGNVDSIFHIGDISYATGFLVEWDFFLHLIKPLASQVSYMTAIGNHERDYAQSGSVYGTPDSGGECGVAYESYFRMPVVGKDKPWYSIEQGSVHFVVMSTEHDWSEKSEQYKWMNQDLSSVNRSRTPWVIFFGHRPMYSSHIGIPVNVDLSFVTCVEQLLLKYQVDLVFFGHVHNYERTCAVYKNNCKGMPKKDASGIDTYDNSNYTAPVHAIVGAGGFNLDNFPLIVLNKWSSSRVAEFGYARVHATRADVLVQFVNSGTMEVRDQFRIVKRAPARKLQNVTIQG